MHRMGHSTARAALIYQHKTPGRDQQIAKSLWELIQEVEASKLKDDLPESLAGTDSQDQ